MSFAGEPNRHGRPSLFTREQHLQALTWFRDQNVRKGALTELANRYGISVTGMTNLLKRAETIARVHA